MDKIIFLKKSEILKNFFQDFSIQKKIFAKEKKFF